VQASTIFAYNLGLCKMLSLVPFFEKTPQPPLLAIAFPNLPTREKDFFAQASTTRNKEKCANALKVLRLKTRLSIQRKILKCG
jgi:hypothetical protein